MAWIRVQSSVPRHPKFLEAGPAASWLWVCGLAYSQEGLTDGFIPFQALSMLGVRSPEPLKRKLVAVGLWDEIKGGWQIHDYLHHNRSADQVRQIQSERREAGSNGGKASWSKRDKQNALTECKQSAEALAEPIIINSTATETETATALTRLLHETEPLTVRQAPLVARRRLDAAWEGPKGLYVPQRKHSDFVALRNHHEAESELLAWYLDVAEKWEGSPGADMFKFWTARYDEKWPAPAVDKVADRRPMWART